MQTWDREAVVIAVGALAALGSVVTAVMVSAGHRHTLAGSRVRAELIASREGVWISARLRLTNPGPWPSEVDRILVPGADATSAKLRPGDPFTRFVREPTGGGSRVSVRWSIPVGAAELSLDALMEPPGSDILTVHLRVRHIGRRWRARRWLTATAHVLSALPARRL